MKVSPMPRPPTAILSRSCASAASAATMTMAAPRTAHNRMQRMSVPPRPAATRRRVSSGRIIAADGADFQPAGAPRIDPLLRKGVADGIDAGALGARRRRRRRRHFERFALRLGCAWHQAAGHQDATVVAELELLTGIALDVAADVGGSRLA